MKTEMEIGCWLCSHNHNSLLFDLKLTVVLSTHFGQLRLVICELCAI